MAEVTIKDIEANIETCKDTHAVLLSRAAEMKSRIKHLKAIRRDLLLAEVGLKRGDKLLVTKEAFTNLGGNAYTFAVGDIWIVNSISENEVITITENDSSRSPYRRSRVNLVQRMKTAYEDSAKA